MEQYKAKKQRRVPSRKRGIEVDPHAEPGTGPGQGGEEAPSWDERLDALMTAVTGMAQGSKNYQEMAKKILQRPEWGVPIGVAATRMASCGAQIS